MVLSGRRFLHKVNMAVRGPMEIINKDEASPCEICQKIATKKPIIFIQRWFMFPFPLFTLPDRIKTKISRFVCGLRIIFSFSMLYSLNIKLTRFCMVSQLLDLVQGLQSLSCQIIKTSDSVSVVVKKKDGLILKSQSFMKYDKCH